MIIIISAYRSPLLDIGLPKFAQDLLVSAILIQAPPAILRKASVNKTDAKSNHIETYFIQVVFKSFFESSYKQMKIICFNYNSSIILYIYNKLTYF